MKPKIYLGADHAGWKLKEELEVFLKNAGHEVEDMGNEELVESDDYPDFGHAVAKQVINTPGSRGILLCGNAQGICIVANKVKGIRAATGFDVEETKTTRTDDNSNILCLPARFIDGDKAEDIVEAWLETPFSGEERHVRRLEKLAAIEEQEMTA